FKAADLMEQQKFTEWQHYASVKPFFSMNGRRFIMTLDDFADIIRNTFQQCNDLDAYTNRKGTRDSCQEYIYNGMKEWIKLSKDPREGANKRGNSSRLTQSFHFFMFEPIFFSRKCLESAYLDRFFAI
ncbi:hypothetical protein OFB65_24150, partial [Escherichia coli]|nr:hypothetical protein [Escherichia coli]